VVVIRSRSVRQRPGAGTRQLAVPLPLDPVGSHRALRQQSAATRGSPGRSPHGAAIGCGQDLRRSPLPWRGAGGDLPGQRAAPCAQVTMSVPGDRAELGATPAPACSRDATTQASVRARPCAGTLTTDRDRDHDHRLILMAASTHSISERPVRVIQRSSAAIAAVPLLLKPVTLLTTALIGQPRACSGAPAARTSRAWPATSSLSR